MSADTADRARTSRPGRYRSPAERFLSSSFRLGRGRHVDPDAVRGYPIDFSSKAGAPTVLPGFLDEPGRHLWVAHAQRGLGAYERWLAGEGEEWLAGARRAADVLVERQAAGGPHDGGWVQLRPYPHTYALEPPWVSAMAQGEGASLLVRLHAETGDEHYAEAARRALRPMRVPSADGGASAPLAGRPFPEEYPTDPPSFVLNGAIFALWGLRDVAVGLGDGDAAREFAQGVDALAASIERWDTGSWSRYDLHPHRVVNVASAAYHELHVAQLEAMGALAPRPELAAAADRFARYAAAPALRARALARKALFRVAEPRSARAARVLPWGAGPGRVSDVLVLCCRALSPDLAGAALDRAEAFERQLALLARRGYRGATVRDAIARPPAERTVAVTFDDAYRSVLELARPILDRLGMPASVYVPTAWPGREEPMTWPGIDGWLGGPHERELACMSWEELRTLADAGWEVGSHTRSHPRLPELDDAALDAELAGSRADCEAALGRPCDSLAYPYGAVDERVVAAAERAGYAYAVSLPRGLHRERPLCWPRVGVYHVDGESDWRWRLKASPLVRRVRGSRAWAAIDGARRGLGGRR